MTATWTRADVERVVCTTWSSVLGVPVEPDEDFFLAGGHSLLVVDAVRELRRHGLAVAVDDVFDHPVPSDLAEVITPGAGTVPDTAPDTGTALDTAPDAAPDPAGPVTAEHVWSTFLSPWSPEAPRLLVELAGGRTDVAPFFCVHWGNGNVRFLAEYVEAWSGGRRVLGFEAAGYRGRVRPLTSIGEMAERYLQELRAEQPHGPYYLGGLCQGGLVAYEMSRRLLAEGEHVEVLVLINPPTQVPMVDRGWGLDELLAFRLASVRDRFGVAGPQDVAGVLPGMVPIGWYDADVTPEDFYRLQVMWTAGMFAQDHYELRPYPGRIVAVEMTGQEDEMDVHWGRAAPQAEITWFEASETLPIIRDPGTAALVRSVLTPADG